MISELNSVWSVLGSIVSAFPSDVTFVICFVFAAIGVVGIIRSM